MAIKKIPCGGFYVDDGAVQNVDGKPVLSAWNADLPKPSAGGYGYTDEDNTIHKIDEKYLPESGDMMHVNIEIVDDEDGGYIRCDKTADELKTHTDNGGLFIVNISEQATFIAGSTGGYYLYYTYLGTSRDIYGYEILYGYNTIALNMNRVFIDDESKDKTWSFELRN